MTEPRFHFEARAEYREAAVFYDSQMADLAAEFAAEDQRRRPGYWRGRE